MTNFLPLIGYIVTSIIFILIFFYLSANDKLTRPIRWLLIVVFLSTAFWLGISYFLNSTASLLLLVFPLVGIFTIIIGISTVITRDKKGVEFGEKIISAFHAIDLQIAYILNIIASEREEDSIKGAISNSLSFVLDSIITLLGFPPDEVHVSLIIVGGENSRVVSSRGIPPGRIALIESKFTYSNKNVDNLVSLALNKKSTIVIEDLTKNDVPEVQYWKPITWDEQRQGSVIVIPILSSYVSEAGNAEKINFPPAVISITFKRPISNSQSIYSIIQQFTPKIEILLSLGFIHNAFVDKWYESNF